MSKKKEVVPDTTVDAIRLCTRCTGSKRFRATAEEAVAGKMLAHNGYCHCGALMTVNTPVLLAPDSDATRVVLLEREIMKMKLQAAIDQAKIAVYEKVFEQPKYPPFHMRWGRWSAG